MTLKQRIAHRLRAWARKLDPSATQTEEVENIQVHRTVGEWREPHEYYENIICATLKEELANKLGSLYREYIEITAEPSEVIKGLTIVTATLKVLKPEHQNE